MPTKKRIKRKSRRSSKSRRSFKSRKFTKFVGGTLIFDDLLKTLNNNLIKQAIQFDKYSIKPNNDFFLSLTESEKKAINYYQEDASLINGFLREGYQILSNFKKKTIINRIGHDDFDSSVKELIYKINLIDEVFTKETCPKTTQHTILYRGTDQLYLAINKGYTSCSKSIETLFDMKFVKGDVDILSNDCCINVLIIDENIPYLDLENNSDTWKYQKEVLLPRGLNIELIEESTIKYKNTDFKVYVTRVMKNNNENVYNTPELPNDDRVEMTKINFIIDEQRREIIKLSKMFIDSEEWSDEKEYIDDLILYIYDLREKGGYTQEEYSKICKNILNKLQISIPAMMKSTFVREECKSNLQAVIDKVEEILSSDEKLITPARFIEVKEC